MAINTAADQKGAAQMAQPGPGSGPDPDRAAALSSDADGASFTEDMPTICGGSPSPMKDIGHNEDITAGAASTPAPKKPQLAQECPAPVYMARTSNSTADTKEAYVLSVCDGMGCLALLAVYQGRL